MKHYIKKLTKTFGLVAATLTAGLVGAASASAWGPERTTFTMENPATYPTFNSITNNPTIGDERDFVRVGQIDSDVTNLGNEVEVIPGKQYLVYIYFHNNASSTFNDSAHNHSGIAFQTKLASSFSTVLTPESRATITGTITANNSNPLSVWDEAYMTTTYPKVLLHYVSGSAKIYNDWAANGSIMPSSLFTEGGTALGLNELNGIIPGCEEYHGVVTYVLQADELKGTIDKEVSTDGIRYTSSVDANPGDEVYFRLTIKNAGDVALTNTTISDAMPSGLELVPGSVEFSANNSGIWESLSDNLIGNGYNFGTLGTGNTIYIKYRAKVADNINCSELNLTNTATLTYDSDISSGDSDNSSTAVNVKKDDCTEPDPEDCTANPALPGCNNPTPSEDCSTNPNLPGCDLPSEIVQTGPLEIVMAAIVILGIGAGGFYLWRTHRTLKTVEDVVSGDNSSNPSATSVNTGSTATSTPVAEPTESASTPIESTSTPIESTAAPAEPATPAESSPLTPASFSEPAAPTQPKSESTPEPGSNESTPESGSDNPTPEQ